jgi:leucyl/phenylalanyl-tRNA--protein transferase
MRLDPETLLAAYAQGAFPMADDDGRIRWYTADPRGLIPLDDRFHVPDTLRQTVRQQKFEIRVNHDFEATVRGCQSTRADNTWIDDKLIAAYARLHALGRAHSVEAWRDGRLVGGLYGVSLGAAFCGESMFHRERDASKVALVALVDRLRERDFELLDAQTSSPHLRKFGCFEISGDEYLERLREALKRDRRFD